MDKKITGIVSYITIIGWLIAFFVGDKEGAKQHLNQALVLGLIELVAFVIGAVFLWIPVIGLILSIVLDIVGVAGFVLAIIGIYYAATDKNEALPFIGGITLLK